MNNNQVSGRAVLAFEFFREFSKQVLFLLKENSAPDFD